MHRQRIILSGVLAVVAALAGGCDTGDAVAAPAPAARGHELFVQIMVALRGTSEQRLAAEQLTVDRQEQARASCMERKGFAYAMMPSPRSAGGPQGLNIGDLSSTAPLGAGDFGIATAARNSLEAADRWAAAKEAIRVPAARERDERIAISLCQRELPEMFEHRPPYAMRLGLEVERIFEGVEKLPVVAAALDRYPGCMREAGFEAKDFSQIFWTVNDRMPRGDTGWAVLRQDPAWAAAVEFEKRAAAADTTCRRPAQDHAMAAAAPRLEEFVADHRAELGAASASWVALLS
ncbi:hypothetical protein [Actinoplanes sp. NPDC051494]|uniref:hypothetical protein n=1 Tax=Actinoplanes sp. NPDC051494 TaxID=3363907 RepID=UPI00378D6ACF